MTVSAFGLWFCLTALASNSTDCQWLLQMLPADLQLQPAEHFGTCQLKDNTWHCACLDCAASRPHVTTIGCKVEQCQQAAKRDSSISNAASKSLGTADPLFALSVGCQQHPTNHVTLQNAACGMRPTWSCHVSCQYSERVHMQLLTGGRACRLAANLQR